MDATIDILRGELERLFSVEKMGALCADYLGFDAAALGAPGPKGAYARTLVDRCLKDDAIEALVDAVFLEHPDADPNLKAIYARRDDAELQTGTVVGQWRISRKIGEGGIGVVYLGEKDSEKAAVKVVRRNHTFDRKAVQRFLTGTRALKTVKHEALLPVLGVGLTGDGRPWVATEYLDGLTLHARVARTGPMHYSEARPVVRAVLQALEALHARGLVHGDVKPENVLMERGPANKARVALTDCGTDKLLSRNVSEVVETGPLPLFGTPKTMAPEVARGAVADRRADLYGMGALLYEILTGRPPFTGQNAMDLVVAHLTREAEPASKHAPRGWITSDLDAVLAKALSKSPTDRQKSAKELLEAFEACSRAQEGGATAEAGPPTASREDAIAAAQLLEENPTDESAAVELEKLAGGAREWQIAVDGIEKAIEKLEDKQQKKDLLFRLARIQDSERKDAAAAEAVYGRILELDPEDEMAQIAVEELKKGAGDFDKVIELLFEKVEKAKDAADRAVSLREIARVYHKDIKDAGKAFEAISMAFLETPRDEAVLRELETITEEARKWMDLVQHVAGQSTQPRPGDDAVALYCHLGRWYARELGRPDFALPSFTQALAIDPGAEGALEGISDIYRRAQQWPELAATLERRADATANPAKARGVLVEAAAIWGERLSDRARARTLYERVLKDDPEHPDALAALEDIYEKDSEWKKLVTLQAARAKHATGTARTELQVKIAEIYEDRLSDADGALDRYEHVLEDDPHNLGALKGLERLYAKVGKYRELLQTLQSQFAVAATPRQKIALLERIGAIREEEFVEYADAAVAYEQVLEIDANHEGALTALGRCYRLQKKWPDVVEILERHAKVVTDNARRIELLSSAGRILKDELSDTGAAREKFEAVLALDKENLEALSVVAEEAAQRGDLGKSVETLEHLVEKEKDPVKKADGWVRIGGLLENGGELDQALVKYRRALDIDAGHVAASHAMRGIFLRREDYGSALSSIEKELAGTKGDLARARLFIEQGKIYREQVADVEKAIAAYKTANGLDPTNVDAASPLAELLFENERWDEAVKIYETWTASADALPKEQKIRLFARLGIIRTKLGRTDAALDAFKKARAAAPDDIDVVRRLADVAFSAGDFDVARAMYAEFLARGGADLSGPDRVEVVFRLGQSKLRCGDAAGAAKSLAEAVAIDPRHQGALESEAVAHAALAQWDEAIRCKRALMELADDDGRHDLLVEVGDLLGDKVGDRAKAAKSYQAALDIRPHDRTVLAKLMQIFSADKDWTKLAEVVVKIAEEIEDGLQRAKYHQTAAAIYAHELDQADVAASLYERALDEDPTMLKSFDGLIELLSSKQDWVGLEKSYRKMLFRLPKQGEEATKIRLWDAVAEIYHHRMQNQAEAVHAYEMAHDLDPDNRRRLETLVDLYEADPKRFGEKAVAAHLDILRHSPYRIDSYKALRRIHTERKRPDDAWCLCAALTNLNMADPEEQGFFEKHRKATPAAATKVLTPDQWDSFLRHESEDPLLTGIFEALYPAVLATRAQKLEEYEVGDADRQDVASTENPVGQMMHYASGVLGTSVPAFYYKEALRQGMKLALSSPPAITAGVETWEWQDTQRTAFVVGRALASLRKAAYVRHLVPTGTGLRAWVLASIKTVVPQFPVPGDLAQPVNEALAAIEKKVMGPDRALLTSGVNKLVQSAAEIDLKRWMAGVDHGCDRVGFVLANDLEVATSVIRKSPEHEASIGTKDRLREIILYAISDSYFKLRQSLGIALRSAG